MDKSLLRVLENSILDRIAGKITLALRDEERESIVRDVLLDACGDVEAKFEVEKSAILESLQDKEKFIKKFFSLDIIEDLLENSDIEDIIINSLSPIFVHTSSNGLAKTDKRFETKQDLDLVIKKMLVFAGGRKLSKINNLELHNMRGRVNIVSSPLGHQLTITKIKEEPLSIINLIDKGTLNFEMAAQLWLYVEGFSVNPANIIVSGGPGSGKTTILNAILGFLPRDERLVVIEDTLELNTKFTDICSRLESSDELTMNDLVKNGLRMRPDRIIIGEVRGQEAQGMMTAMNIGKHCMGTIHANNARETILRLQSAPMNVPEPLIGLINVFIIMRKCFDKGEAFRVVHEIGETAGLQERKVLLSYLWEYDIPSRQFMKTAPSSIFRDKLAHIADVSPKRIIEEVNTRTKILKALKRNNIYSIQKISQICEEYRTNPKKTISTLRI